MRILLIDPPGQAYGLNLGLGYIAAALLSDGNEVKVIDLNNNRGITPQMALEKTIFRWKPELIGISVHSTTYHSSLQIASYIKSVSSVPIVVGGAEISLEEDEILKCCANFDFAVIGESEVTIKDLVMAIKSGRSFDLIEGLIFRRDSNIVKNPYRPVSNKPNTVCSPNYRCFGISKIIEYPIITSIGCPYHCSFCFKPTGRKWRRRDLEAVINELEEAKKLYEIERFGVWDPVFNLYTRHVSEFCRKLIKTGINLPWYCYSVRADTVDEAQAEIMSASGCREVSMGVESLVPYVLKYANKKVTIHQIENAVEIFHKYHINIIGFFIIGLPYDTYDNVMKTHRLAKEIGVDRQFWAILVPYPKTWVFEWVKTNGRILMDYRNVPYRGSPTGDYPIVFDTPDFPQNERVTAYYKVMYGSKHYVLYPEQSFAEKARYFIKGLLKYDRNVRHLPSHFNEIVKYLCGKRRIGANYSQNLIFDSDFYE